jgi:hypothetical protein
LPDYKIIADIHPSADRCWIESRKLMPVEGQTVVIWDADWCEPFIKTMRPSLHWDMRRFTHWYPLPDQSPPANAL